MASFRESPPALGARGVRGVGRRGVWAVFPPGPLLFVGQRKKDKLWPFEETNQNFVNRA